MAGVAFWMIGSLIPNLSFMWTAGLFSKHLTAFTTSYSGTHIPGQAEPDVTGILTHIFWNGALGLFRLLVSWGYTPRFDE
jgi:hypothetical protein